MKDKRTKVNKGDPSQGGSHEREVSKQQENLSLMDLW